MLMNLAIAAAILLAVCLIVTAIALALLEIRSAYDQQFGIDAEDPEDQP